MLLDIAALDTGFKNKRILVTGGNGFIGSHLVKRLVGYGAQVTIITRESSDLWRIKDELKELDILKVDIRDKDRLKASLGEIKAEYIFHMSAYGVDHRNSNYQEAANTNIIGTINLVEALSDIGCSRIINVGSGMEYGCYEGKIAETVRANPNSIYGSTKAASTIIAHQIAAEKGTSLVTLRPFWVFGEYEDGNRLFAHIILSILKDRDVSLTLCEQFRDYCYVGNIIDGFLMSALCEGINNEIFNIGSGTSYSLRYYVDLLFRYLKTDKKPLFGTLPYRENDLCHIEPDISKIKELIGWKPRVGLEEGIERTIKWYKDNMDKYQGMG